MADGDIYLPLTYDDGRPPADPDPVPPALPSCAEELYAALFPFARSDHEHDWALAKLCRAIGAMRQAVSDLVRDDDEGRPGWTRATDVDLAPGADEEIDMLPFLAMLVGVRLTPEMNDADRRAAIREREGFWRGRPDAIRSFVGRYTTRPAVTIRERYNPSLGAGVDAPYYGEVRIRRAALRPGVDPDELRRRVLAQIPAGLIYTVVITDAADFEQVRADFADFDDLSASFPTFDDLTAYEGE